MTEMQWQSSQLQRLAASLASGLLSVSEVASSILEVLAESADRAGLWTGSPTELREQVLTYLAEIGADEVPPMFWIGPGEPDPIMRAAHTARRRLVARELLANAERNSSNKIAEPLTSE